MITNTHMENEKSREMLCILSILVELLPSNKILPGTMICKTKGKTALLGELMGKAGALPTFSHLVHHGGPGG